MDGERKSSDYSNQLSVYLFGQMSNSYQSTIQSVKYAIKAKECVFLESNTKMDNYTIRVKFQNLI